MEVVPREEAFLGGIKKAIKKVSKAVKNVAKSPVGKAAMLYFAPMAFGQSAGLAGYKGLFNKVSPAFSNLLKAKGTTEKISGVDKAIGALKVGAATSAITGLLAAAEQGDEDAIEATTNVESLKKYLYSSYENLGYNPQEIPALVQRDVSEYTSGAGGYATGGRVKYQQGSGIGTLQGGSQTTPTTGKASYAEGPQLYRDLIDYLQIQGPKPEMINSEMMMDDMGGAMPAYGGSGSSGGTTGSSITSGSTGGGSGTGILQATPGTTQPTTTSSSNVSQSTTQTPIVKQQPIIDFSPYLSMDDITVKVDPLGRKVINLTDQRKLQEGMRSISELLDKKYPYGSSNYMENKIKAFSSYFGAEDPDSIYWAEYGRGKPAIVQSDEDFGTYKDPQTGEIIKFNQGGRVGYASGTDEEGVRSIKPKKKPSAEKRILDMLDQNKKAAYNTLGPRNMFERMAKSAVEAYKNGEISKREFDRMIMPFFGRGGEMLTSKIDKERQYLDDVSMGKGFESGGRVGFDEGGYTFEQFKKDKFKVDQFMGEEQMKRLYEKMMREKKVREQRNMAAYGGRMEYAMGSPEDNARKAAGIMDLPLNENKAGVTELDLRETGGFIPPVGVKEKADDIPAMLSNNEFVFTADAVRGMGNGDVNVGAQRMYDMMKKLENGGRV